nr:hypothetical protein [Candidatus Freyarchaeota archaeon]
MKFFEDAQKGIASATGQPLVRKELGIPPKYFFVCAHCRRDLGPIPISMNILQGTLPIQVLKQAGNFMKQCPTCKLWVCPSCYNNETNRCIQ